MMERIEKDTPEWEYLEGLWDQWEKKLASHGLEMGNAGLTAALTGRAAYFKLNKTNSGDQPYRRGGVVINKGVFDDKIWVEEGSLIIGGEITTTDSTESRFVVDGYVEESVVVDTQIRGQSTIIRSALSDCSVQVESCIAGSYLEKTNVVGSEIETSLVRDSSVARSQVSQSLLMDSTVSNVKSACAILGNSQLSLSRLDGDSSGDGIVALKDVDLVSTSGVPGGFVGVTKISGGTGIIARPGVKVGEPVQVNVTDRVPWGIFAAEDLAVVTSGCKVGTIGYDYRNGVFATTGETGLIGELMAEINKEIKGIEDEYDPEGTEEIYNYLGERLLAFVANLENLGFNRELRIKR